MAKRKVTVTLDEELVDVVKLQGADNLSAVLNEALAEHADRIGRRASLRELLDKWDSQLGPVSARARLNAKRAFDELDGLADAETA